jgi:IS5 family transposase
MRHADQALDDEQLVSAVYEAVARRHPKSRTRGRRGTPAEVVLRLLLLKHIRNWSYGVLERKVRANLVYRDFTRVRAAKVSDAKSMGRWGLAPGPEEVGKIPAWRSMARHSASACATGTYQFIAGDFWGFRASFRSVRG